jgi:N-ethylmaleimide reductase
MATLFDPVTVGDLSLQNRFAMAPLTRNRSPGATPTELSVTYYSQRATAGLLITEATAISHQGQGYADVPGLYGAEQLAAWRTVTDAVHEAGGKIVTQLWHVGRISHDSLQPGGGKPVAPSALRAKSKTYLISADGTGTFAETSEPRALKRDELPGIVADYHRASKAAVEDAGFDGVEIHAANGYLVDQFLRSGSNHRTDEYGGSIENRARFLFEVVEAVVSAVGAVASASACHRSRQPTMRPTPIRSRFSTMSRTSSPPTAWLISMSSKGPPAATASSSRAASRSTMRGSRPPIATPAARARGS